MKPQLIPNWPNPLKSAAKLLLLAGFSCLMGSTLFAVNQTWTGAVDNNFWTSGNWGVSGTTPVQNLSSYITTPGANVIIPPGGSNGSGLIGVYGDTTQGAAPVLNMISGAFFYCNGSSLRIGSYMTNGGGVFNQTGGEICASNPSLPINIAAAQGTPYANASGTLNFGGPTNANKPVDALGNGGGFAPINVGQSVGETGVLNFTGYGTFNTAGTQTNNGFNGAQGPGGSISLGASGGNGTISITGGNLSILTGTLNLGGATSGTATLKETIDTTGISLINAAQIVSIGAHAYFNLSLGTGFSATNGQVFTLMSTATQISGAFANLANGGTVTVNSYTFLATYGTNFSNDTFTLTVTAVPEPSSALFVLSGLTGMVLGLRRRSRAGCFAGTTGHKPQKLSGIGNKPRG